MTLTRDVLYGVLLPIEIACLFAVWHWRLRGGAPGWLALAILLAALAIVALTFLPPALHTTALLAMTGMYVFSGLAWAWWADGLNPARWSLAEILVAAFAAALFSIAASQSGA
jgi:drug/metabolite transporter superfamily protein YnfA